MLQLLVVNAVKTLLFWLRFFVAITSYVTDTFIGILKLKFSLKAMIFSIEKINNYIVCGSNHLIQQRM